MNRLAEQLEFNTRWRWERRGFGSLQRAEATQCDERAMYQVGPLYCVYI